MTSLRYVVALSALSLAACVTHERTVVHETPVVREQTTVVHDRPAPVVTERTEREVVITPDAHRTWWNAYHPGEVYEPTRAVAAHRLFCTDHPDDTTCAGWDWR